MILRAIQCRLIAESGRVERHDLFVATSVDHQPRALEGGLDISGGGVSPLDGNL